MRSNSNDHRETSDDPGGHVLQRLPTGVQPGALIDVRGTRWRLEQAIPRDDCCELHLASTADAGRRVLLWPFDRPTAVDSAARVTIVRVRHWLRAIAAAQALEVGPWTPRATSVRADVLPYQLEPAMAVAQGALRLVLADEVGLGKTVQAAWIAADVVERERDARVLIAVPAGLRRQWQTELDSRFSLRSIAVDAAWLRASVADLPADVSPWSAPGIYVGSVDFLKRLDVAESLRSHLWDLLIVDEAHGSTAPTDRHAALEAVALRSRRIVAITATPFSGDAARFSSLLALGTLSPADPAPVMFRRSREHIGDCRPRRHRFVLVRITEAESRLQRLLERYSREVWHEGTGDVKGARLAVTILRKRALSSPVAAARSLARRLALLQGTATAPSQLSFLEDGDAASDDELMDSALAAPGLRDAARERRWLARMSEAAAEAVSGDSKLRRVVRLLQRTGEAAIVFTEYRDTLRHLATALPSALQMHGGMSTTERAVVQQQFNDEGGWLLATDAASEGLNLQHRCRLIVNYELPWNPARVEQRIGRVDRIGQHKPVHAITLVARDTAEDLVVAQFTRRLARIAAALGERDRLAVFLDEARIARSVIASDQQEAGDLTDPADNSGQSEVSAFAPPDLREAAARAACEIQRRVATAGQWTQAPVASAFGRGPLLRPGFVIALRCTAQTSGGSIVARRLAIVHVEHTDEPRPARAADVRTRATAAVNRLIGVKDDAIPQLSEWFEGVQRGHARAVDLQIARETAVLDRRIDTIPVQPGLFDRRALAAADRQSGIDAALQDAARERIARLDCARLLQLNLTPAGILVLWR